MNEKDKIISDALTRVVDATKFADTKVGILGTICAIYVGLARNLLDGYLRLVADVSKNPSDALRLIVPTAALSGFFYFLIRTLLYITRTLRARIHDEGFNPLFFGHIARTPKDEYIELMKKRSSAELKADLVSQLHVNSKITAKKYRYANEAINGVVGATLFLAIAAVSLSASFHF